MPHTNSLVFAGIAPHPPIMVPEVGGESCVEVQNSISAMAELTERIIKSGAETVVLISPHAPLEAVAFVAYDGPMLHGDFAMFRAPGATVQATLDDELLTEISRAAEEYSLITLRIRDADLDHGTTVPLYFLQRNGWEGKLVALGYSFLSNEDHLRFGNCIRQAIATLKRPVAFIASGDLSHRLKPGAPAGYQPDAHLFDEEVVDAIRSCETNRIVNIDQNLRRAAGECGYRSMLVALGVIEGIETSCEVLSYEGPFGVGYLVAQLVGGSARRDRGSSPTVREGVSEPRPVGIAGGPSSSAERMTDSSPVPTNRGWDPHLQNSYEPAKRATDDSSDSANGDQSPTLTGGTDIIPALARHAIETFVRDGTIIDAPRPSAIPTRRDSDNTTNLLAARAGCFVSIKTHEGDLRGCIGTIDPAKDTLAEEIVTNAISAAARDPRFPPVRADELLNLKYSVDVLSAPEPCTFDDLDPRIYGVIVEDESGVRRGLLLPNLEGINTSAQQVEIASRKAGIPPGKPVKLFRFHADRYSE